MDTSLTFASNRLFDTFREVEAGGKQWLVVNGVPLVEGVLNGRFVSADEFGSFINDWNDIPVVLPHPKRNGGSARVPAPDVPVVGRFYNARLDGKRLVGEYWLDKQMIENLSEGAELMDLISKQKPIETSTGYWSESIPQAGRFNGSDYSYVDQKIHPDHIALLTQEAGACSLADGCGMNRNQKALVKNSVDGSLEQKMERINRAFNEQFTRRRSDLAVPGYDLDFYVMATFIEDSYVVASSGGDLYRVGFITRGDEYIFDDRDKWQEVIRREQYIPVINQNVTGSLPAEGKKIWEDVYQKSKEKYGEERAAKIAWSAVKRAGWKQDKDGEWSKPEKPKQNQRDLEGLAVALLLSELLES